MEDITEELITEVFTDILDSKPYLTKFVLRTGKQGYINFMGITDPEKIAKLPEGMYTIKF